MAGYSPVFWKCGEHLHSITGESTSPSTICPRTCSFSVCTRRDLPRPGLADDQDDLTHALLGLLPAVLQQADLVVASGQRRQPRALRHLDGVEILARSLHQEELDGLRDP